ncbi:DEAD-box ATP-dependent RNA helicase 37 [Hibiscus syriacus]|uniref:DEAD-box ATP-dependent RNA helicase 37 n=2 Tax=Hibiscus syriacus TaxID=106335 RepID=A0A6A2WSM6_HIBSY|nr:DEAD-box ATP-dependent RNA helicase 37 [Hibiscus syriacus]
MDNTDVDNVKPTEECHEVHNVDESDRLVGQLFCSRDQAWHFYKGFAREHGFSARKGTTRLDVEGNVKTQEFCCSKEGFRVSKVNTVDRQRAHTPVTRTGCKARVVVTATNTNDQWVISKSDQKHNHALCTSAMTPFMRSNRAVSKADIDEATTLKEVGVGTSQVWEIMRTSWADSASETVVSNNNPVPRPSRPTYVPPHLRNSAVSDAPTPSGPPTERESFGGNTGGSRWSGSSRTKPEYGRQMQGNGYDAAGRDGGGSCRNNRSGGWDRRKREVNPFVNDDKVDDMKQGFSEHENTVINFDAYEDIPVEISGENVPPPVNTFAEIDLGEMMNQNIRRCKYAKPTPVQRYAIPIALGGRDLMACAQTGSGKTAAFCFPIISGIMREQYGQRARGGRTVYPLGLILSPTRELSCQIHDEAKKFSYQTGVKVVVAYGGARINQQVVIASI